MSSFFENKNGREELEKGGMDLTNLDDTFKSPEVSRLMESKKRDRQNRSRNFGA